MKIPLKVSVSRHNKSTRMYKCPISPVTLWTYITGLRAAQPHYCVTLIKAAELNPSARSKKQSCASKNRWKKRVQGNESVRVQRKHTPADMQPSRGFIRGVHPDYLCPKTHWGVFLVRFLIRLSITGSAKWPVYWGSKKSKRAAQKQKFVNLGWSRFASARLRTGATCQKSPESLRRQHLIGRFCFQAEMAQIFRRGAGSFTESSSTF